MHIESRKRLIDYANNVNSQFGEDGIIAKILETIPERDMWCVEFGAWDGRLLSNTCQLIEKDSYSAVLIECDEAKWAELKRNFANYPQVIPIKRMVGFDNNRLDEILATTPIPKNFDFISIDIDGCDYHIWESLHTHQPKVVCIEYNPTIPTGVKYVQARDFSVAQGCSVDSLVELGNVKGYELIATTRNNAFFVLKDLFPLFHIGDNRIEILREDAEWVNHVICGYDGELIITGANLNPWNGVQLDRMVRQLPKPLRVFPSSMGLARKKMLGLWKKLFKLNHPNPVQ